jgi:hypothetical protein
MQSTYWREGILTLLLTGALFFSCEQPGGLSAPGGGEDRTGQPVQRGIEIVGITILSPPDTIYYVIDEEFKSDGLKVAWLYSDGSTVEIPPEGYDLIDTPRMDRASAKDIRVRAGGFEISFRIQVTEDGVLQSIMVSGPDNKTQILGKEFDITGLVVTGHFSSGDPKVLNVTPAIVGYDKFKRGPQDVSVKVNGKTASIEGITTRIGEDATVTLDTGYGVQTAFIKGEALTPEKANLMFNYNYTNLTANQRTLSLANGGLVPADFAGLISQYQSDHLGKQTLTMTLDGKDFLIDFYVVNVEPDVWFDFGYMRHDGDPTGHGPGAGKFYARPNETLIIAPVRYLIGYNEDHSDAGEVSYTWTVSAPHTTSQGDELLHVTPAAEGTYPISVSVTGKNYITGSNITKTAEAELVCYTGSLPEETFTSPLRNFGPGQMCEGGTGLGWSLGSAGGYEVWKVEPRETYRIEGNPMDGWREPGVVWIQEDNNGNGLPDEMWYELTGGDETALKNQITRRYALTYFKGSDHDSVNQYNQVIKEVYWADSRGRAGMIPGGFPDKYWDVTGNWVTYTCTLLRDDGQIFAPGYNMAGLEGYVDCADPHFSIDKAVKADGTRAYLSAVRFIKVQTSMFRYGDIFGDVSTEIHYADFLGYQTDFPLP